MNLNTLKAVFLALLFNLCGFSQDFSINKIEPPNWWIGMKWDTVQLMIYVENLGEIKVRSEDSNFKILDIHSTMNSTYLFVDIYIPVNLPPANYNLIFYNDDIEKQFTYQILSREKLADTNQGFSNEDVI